MDWPEPVSKNNVVAWLILGYFCSHPSAKDTAVGVSRWWLKGVGVETNQQVVEDALNYLVAKGWVTMTKAPSGLKLYALNLLRQQALQQFLHGQPRFH